MNHTQVLYNIEIRRLSALIRSIRTHHKNLHTDGIVLIHSIALYMVASQGHESLTSKNTDSDVIANATEFQSEKYKDYSEVGHINDSADCYRLAYLIDKIRGRNRLYTSTEVLMYIITLASIEWKVNLVDMSNSPHIEKLYSTVIEHYNKEAYEVVARDLIVSTTFNERLQDLTTKTGIDINSLGTDADSFGLKLELLAAILTRYHHSGKDYTMFNTTDTLDELVMYLTDVLIGG